MVISYWNWYCKNIIHWWHVHIIFYPRSSIWWPRLLRKAYLWKLVRKRAFPAWVLATANNYLGHSKNTFATTWYLLQLYVAAKNTIFLAVCTHLSIFISQIFPRNKDSIFSTNGLHKANRLQVHWRKGTMKVTSNQGGKEIYTSSRRVKKPLWNGEWCFRSNTNCIW